VYLQPLTGITGVIKVGGSSLTAWIKRIFWQPIQGLKKNKSFFIARNKKRCIFAPAKTTSQTFF
ncbi:hypothetical protein, partial [Salegentibacter sp. F14]